MIELPPPPPTRDQRRIDADQLNLISIFHFVGAGLSTFAILALLAHYAVFHALITNPKLMGPGPTQMPPSPAEFFALFKWFYLVFAIWFASSAILNLISGLCIRARKHRTFSLVVGAINCLHLPIGTVLGVFTIIILMRASVRELYEAG